MGATPPGIRDITGEAFSTQSTLQGGVIAVDLRGNAEGLAHEPLKVFLQALETAAKAQRVREVVFQLQELYFLSSSCLSLFLHMLNGLLEGQAGAGLKVRFRSNPNLSWQARSLSALQSYAPDIVTVE